MAIVQKLNKMLRISDEKLEEYLEIGYNQLDENGKVIKNAKVTSIQELLKVNEKLEREIKNLKYELKQLKEGAKL